MAIHDPAGQTLGDILGRALRGDAPDLSGTGATVLALLVLCAGVVGFAVAAALGILSEIFGWNDGLAELWLTVTAVVWLPLAIGSICRQWSFRKIMALGGDELDKYRSR